MQLDSLRGRVALWIVVNQSEASADNLGFESGFHLWVGHFFRFFSRLLDDLIGCWTDRSSC